MALLLDSSLGLVEVNFTFFATIVNFILLIAIVFGFYYVTKTLRRVNRFLDQHEKNSEI